MAAVVMLNFTESSCAHKEWRRIMSHIYVSNLVQLCLTFPEIPSCIDGSGSSRLPVYI